MEDREDREDREVTKEATRTTENKPCIFTNVPQLFPKYPWRIGGRGTWYIEQEQSLLIKSCILCTALFNI